MVKRFNLPLIIAIFIAVSIYWAGLSGPLILDDFPQIIPIVKNINKTNWSTEYKEYIFSNSGVLSRPVSMISFIYNAATTGNNIWYFKLTNLILHILCGYSIYIFSNLVLSFDPKKKHNKNLLSVAVAAIWLVHPLNVSTVLYVVQRMSILSALFTINALLCYLYALKESDNIKIIFYILTSALIFAPLALFSKENAALLPVYILISTLYVTREKTVVFSTFPAIIKAYNYLMIAIVILGIIILIKNQNYLIFDSYNSREFTLYERILTQSRVIFLYLHQIIIPLPSNMGFFHDDFLISKDLFTPRTTLVSVLSIIIIIIYSIINTTKHPVFVYGIFFYFSSHLLESTIFPLEIAFEHRNYIGMWGILLFFVCIVSKLHDSKFYLISIFIILSSLTFFRALTWNNLNSMYPYMMSIHPNSKRLNIIYAESYANSGKYERALQHLHNDSLGTQLQRLNIKCHQYGKLQNGDLLKAINSNDNIIIGTYEMEGIINISNLGLDNKCIFSSDEFIQLLLNITTLESLNNTDAQKVFLYLAHFHHKSKHIDLSIIALNNSFSSEPTNPIPLFLMVEWLIEYKNIEKARTVFKQAKTIANNSFLDYTDFITRINPMIQ